MSKLIQRPDRIKYIFQKTKISGVPKRRNSE
jgi:hypothetical protein